MKTSIMLLGLLWVGPAAGAQTGDPERDASVDAALLLIESRDPELSRDLRRALAEQAEEASRTILGHAQYLRELDALREEHPEKYRLMVQQEQLERQVRALVERWDQLGPDGNQRQSVEEELRDRLGGWFELRQAIRAEDVELLALELAQNQRELGAVFQNLGEAREGWLQRILAASEEQERRRLLLEFNEFHALAPELMMRLERRFPEQAARMWQQMLPSRENDPRPLFDALGRLAAQHPGLLEEVRQAAADEVAGLAKLRDALLEAFEILERQAGADGTIASEQELRERMKEPLRILVDAEIEITRLHLERVRLELGEQTELLEARRERRELIVDLELARLLWSEHLLDW